MIKNELPSSMVDVYLDADILMATENFIYFNFLIC